MSCSDIGQVGSIDSQLSNQCTVDWYSFARSSTTCDWSLKTIWSPEPRLQGSWAPTSPTAQVVSPEPLVTLSIVKTAPSAIIQFVLSAGIFSSWQTSTISLESPNPSVLMNVQLQSMLLPIKLGLRQLSSLEAPCPAPANAGVTTLIASIEESSIEVIKKVFLVLFLIITCYTIRSYIWVSYDMNIIYT